MAYLNIPLERHGKTTRRSPRRVVSLWRGIGLLAFVLFTWMISTWYFTNNTLDAAAPDGTVAVAHFHPNRRNWSDLEALLRNVTLISERSLTIQDISAFIGGEFSLFFLDTGERALGVRVTDALPQNLLDDLQIVSQELDSGHILLSNRLLPISGVKTSLGWREHIPIPGSNRLGSLHLLEEGIAGGLYANKKAFEIRLPKGETPPRVITELPEGTLALLSTTALTNDALDPISRRIQSLIASSENQSSVLGDAFTAHGGTVLLTNNESGVNVLAIVDKEAIPEGQEVELLRSAAALNDPKTVVFTLPDESRVRELVADPSNVTIEETIIAGTPISRVTIKEGEGTRALLTGRTEAHVFLSTNEDLLTFWLGNEEEGVMIPCSTEASTYLNLDELMRQAAAARVIRESTLVRPLSETFSSLTIDSTTFSTRIRACRS